MIKVCPIASGSNGNCTYISDGKVNIQDVILLAQYCASWDEAMANAYHEAIDANGDGKTNVQDVILLSQFCANWDVELA